MEYEDFTKAFVGELAMLLADGHSAEAIVDPASPASKFGQSPRGSLERFGASFSVADVSCPILSSRAAPFNLVYGVGLLMWTFSGSTDSEWLQYYGGRPDRRRGASLGKRLFNNNGLDKVELAINILVSDPGSRRAFMPVFDMRDVLDPSLEVPCSAGLQLFVRSGRLHAVTVMRAQNALDFLAMDVFVFSYLFQYVADRLNLMPGSYTHMCTSFHIFKEDAARAKKIVSGAEEVEAFSLGDLSGISIELEELLHLEEHLRGLATRGNAREIRALGKSGNLRSRFQCEICRNVAGVLLATALRRVGDITEVGSLELSPELLQLLSLTADVPCGGAKMVIGQARAECGRTEPPAGDRQDSRG